MGQYCTPVPDPNLHHPDADLRLHAYRHDVFPMVDHISDDMEWFSPDPRAAIPLNDRFHVSRSLARGRIVFPHLADALVPRSAACQKLTSPIFRGRQSLLTCDPYDLSLTKTPSVPIRFACR